MKRKIKALGLALVAVLAIGAVAAQGAWANAPKFAAGGYPAHITAEADPSAPAQTLTTSIGEVTCSELSGTATLEGQSSELLGEHIEYDGCQLTEGEVPATVAMNGCHYVFEVQATVSETTSTGSVDIECTTKKPILIDVDDGACLIEVPGGQHLTGVAYHNVHPEGHEEELTVEANLANQLEAAYEGALCGEGVDKEASYSGKLIASAKNEAEEPIDATVEPGSKTDEGAADFAASEYPAFIEAAGHGTQKFETSIGTESCEEVTGSSTLSEQSGTMTGENIAYGGCTASGIFPMTIDMNGCNYVFDAGTTNESGSTGSVEIDCPEPSQGITIRIFAFGSTSHETKDLLCEIHIPEQTPTSGSVTYENVEDEGNEAITVELEDVKVHRTITGTEQTETHPNYICEHETDTNFVYNGGFTATAENEIGENIDTTIEGT
jgi:hypothetical protein